MSSSQPERPWRRLVLIAGHRRSGSTWLAAVLGESEDTRLIPYEPLWLKWHPGSPHNPQIREWRNRQSWHIGWDTESSQGIQDGRLIRQHISWLCDHYFGGPVDTLILKEPHPNWLPFLAGALAPDHIVFLQRHPLGIINSYDSANLYTRWQVEDEWQKFLQDLPGLAPELAPAAASLQHPAERVALMIHAGNLIFERLVFETKQALEYEQLCLDPNEGFAEVHHRLGLDWGHGAQPHLKKLIDPDGDQLQDGFIKVRKRSYERAYAWRTELPPHLIARVERLLARLGPGYPRLGADLPPLSRAEKRKGWRSYAARRRAYLRHFGIRSLLRSL